MQKLLWSLAFLPFVLFGLQACGPRYIEQPDCGFLQNVYGERISWKNNAPVPLYVHSSVPSQYYAAIQSAISKWEGSSGRPLFRIAGWGVQGPLEPRQDGMNVIYWMNTWEAEKSNEQGRTSVYWVGDQIREADIRINAVRAEPSGAYTGFSFYLDQPSGPYSREVHFESLMIHELGHVLGLKHQDQESSVMGTYLAANTIRPSDGRIPTADLEALKCEY